MKKIVFPISFLNSISLLETGIYLLCKNCWEITHKLTLVLYKHAAESELGMCKDELMKKLTNVILENARSSLDLIQIHILQIYRFNEKMMFIDAILTANFILHKIGVDLAKDWFDSSSASTIQVVNNLLCNLSNKEIVELKSISMNNDSIIKAFMTIRISAFQENRILCVYVVMRIIEFTLMHGSKTEKYYKIFRIFF